MELVDLLAAGGEVGMEEVSGDAPGEVAGEGAVEAAADSGCQGEVGTERECSAEMRAADEAVDEDGVVSDVLRDLRANHDEEDIGSEAVAVALAIFGGVDFEADPGKDGGFEGGLPAVHAAADGIVLVVLVVAEGVGVAAVEFVIGGGFMAKRDLRWEGSAESESKGERETSESLHEHSNTSLSRPELVGRHAPHGVSLFRTAEVGRRFSGLVSPEGMHSLLGRSVNRVLAG